MNTPAFPVGAWVMDPMMRRLSGGIEKNAVTGEVRFAPYAGEIIGTGLLCKVPVYRIKFAESFGFVVMDDAICYQCHTASDNTHHELCPDKAMRAWEHEPGYAA